MRGILAFIFIFGVIVVVHEFGHFYFAKKAGILVREFGAKDFRSYR
jgi:regulator of sigma E protease